MANDTVCHRMDAVIGNNNGVQLIVAKIAKFISIIYEKNVKDKIKIYISVCSKNDEYLW